MCGSAAAADLRVGVAPAPLPYEPGLPACDDPAVLSDIVERQHWAEENTWHNGVLIEGIADVRQRSDRLTFVTALPHRTCEARADLTLDLRDRLFYVIYGELGFSGTSLKVDFCMPNHDYWKVYDADCRVLR